MKWEYKIIKVRTTGWMGGKFDEAQLTKSMNETGAEGWELATAFDTNEAGGNTRDVVLLFKKPSGG